MTYFSAKSFANLELPAARVVDATYSGVLVLKLNAWVHSRAQPIGPAPAGGTAPSFTAGIPWLDTNIPVFAGDPARVQKVTLNSSWPELAAQQQAAFNAVPVPDVAVGSPDGDRSLVIVDGDTLYELWGFARSNGACTAWGGGVIRTMSAKASNYNEMCCLPESMSYLGSQWGVQASGFSFLAGMVTCDEWKARSIPHAVALHVPWARQSWFSSPAQRTDGRDANFDGLPYGARFFLPATFDMDAYQAARAKTEPGYQLFSMDRAIVTAWMKYGCFPVDQTGVGVGIVAENPVGWRARNNTMEDPYGASFDRKAMMLRLPWEKLQVLKLDLRRGV